MKKHSTPLPRTKTAIALLFFLLLGFTGFAQSSSEKSAIKEWLVANKDKMTLVSMKEYQSMSPSVKSMLDADEKVLIYNTEVTSADITKFENKNIGKGLVAFKAKSEKEAISDEKIAMERQKSELQAQKDKKEADAIRLEAQNLELQAKKAKEEKIAIWLEANKNIKIISYQDYMSRPAAQKAAIDAVPNIIYQNEELRWEDIEKYEGSK